MQDHRSVASPRPGIATWSVGDEVVAYDNESERVHALDPLSAAVLDRCDGTRSVEELAAALEAIGVTATDDSVHQAVCRLESAGIVDVTRSDDTTITRRRAIHRVALAGAVGVAVPTIQSVILPTVAAASSHGGGSGSKTFSVRGSITLSGPIGGDPDEAQSTLNFAEVGGGLTGTWSTGPVPGSYTYPHSMTNPTGTIHWSDGTVSTATASQIWKPPSNSPLTVSSLAFTSGPFSSTVTFSFAARALGLDADGRFHSSVVSFGPDGTATVTLS